MMQGGTMYEQRDIILIPFPYSDLTGSKQRPALIISNSKINKSEDRICVLITSNKPKEGFEIKEDLPFKSWVKPNRLFTVHKKIIRKKICSVSVGFHEQIVEEINNYIKNK